MVVKNEVRRDHAFTISSLLANGGDVARIGGAVRSVGMRRSRNPGKPVFWEFAVSKRTKSHPNKYYSKIRSTTVASQAFTRSAGESESCIPRIPALMWIFSRLIAEESMKVRSFFFIPRGEQPPRT